MNAMTHPHAPTPSAPSSSPVSSSTSAERDPRQRLLDAAAAEAGPAFHRVQVATFARRAGVSTGTFYRYFRDKDDLLVAVLRLRFSAFLDELRKRRWQINLADPLRKMEIIRGALRFAFTFHLEEPQVFLAWYAHGHGGSEVVQTLVQAFLDDLEAIVAADVGGSSLVHVPRPDLAARAIVGMTFQLVYQAILHEQTSDDEVDQAVEHCAQLVAGGLLSFAPPEVRAALEALGQSAPGDAGT